MSNSFNDDKNNNFEDILGKIDNEIEKINPKTISPNISDTLIDSLLKNNIKSYIPKNENYEVEEEPKEKIDSSLEVNVKEKVETSDGVSANKVKNENTQVEENANEVKRKTKIDSKFVKFFSVESETSDFEDEETITQLKLDLDDDIKKDKHDVKRKINQDYKKLNKLRSSKVKAFNLKKTETELDLNQNIVLDRDIIINTNLDEKDDEVKNKTNKKGVIFKKSKRKFKNNSIDREADLEVDVPIDMVNEFVEQSDKEKVESYIHFQKSGLVLKSVIAFLSSLLILLISVSDVLNLSSIQFFNYKENPIVVSGWILFFILLNLILNFQNIFIGFTNIFKKNGDSDTLLSISFLALFISMSLVFFNSKNSQYLDNHIFVFSIFVAFMCLCLNNLMKYISINRILLNFEYISDEKREKYVFSRIKNDIISSQITSKLLNQEYIVGLKSNRDFIKNYVSHSFSLDYYDIVSKKVSIVSFFFCFFIIPIITIIANGDIVTACMNAAIFSTLINPINGMGSIALILKKLQNVEKSKDAFICSYKSIDIMSKVNCVIIEDSSIFDKSSISISCINTFNDMRIDNILIYVSSILAKNKSSLSDVFLDVIENNNKFLMDVSELKYENSMGYSAVVDGKVVLVGNRNLLINHSISVLKKDIEDNLLDVDKNIMYVAVDNKVSSVFVLQYSANPKVQSYIDKLIKHEVSIAIKALNPCFDIDTLSHIYDYPKECVTVINSEIHDEIDMPDNQTSFDGDYVFFSNDDQYINMISESKDIIGLIKSSIMIQIAISLIISFFYFFTSVVFKFNILTINLLSSFLFISFISGFLSFLFVGSFYKNKNSI